MGLLAYANTFDATFVFDDFANIVDYNSTQSLGGAITDTLHSRVVGYFTFALNYKIHDLDVAGYHAVNLAVHLSCALLVFWLVLLTLKTPFFEGSRLARSRYAPLLTALFAGLVFVSHPVQTQAVTYTVQRFTSLATLFYLLSLTLYGKWRLAGDNAAEHSLLGYKVTVGPGVKKTCFYACSLFSALLAMLTKEIAFTLPAVVALWEFSFFEGGIKRRIKNLLPFLLTLPVIPLAVISSGAPLLSALADTEPPPATDYLLTQFRVIVTYLRLFFLPLGQNLDYDYPIYSSFLDPNVLLSFIFLLAIAGLGVLLWRYSRKRGGYAPLRLIAFGIFWFFITLSVESSFITITDVIYEHRLYLPSVGLIVATVAAVAVSAIALREKLPSIGRVLIPLGAMVVVALAVATYERNQVWDNPVTMWDDSARKSPGKARPHNNLGIFYYKSGYREEAKRELMKAIELDSTIAMAHNGLGVIYLESGQPEEAKRELMKAIELEPDFALPYYNLGVVLVSESRLDDAIGPFQKAIELDPGNFEVRFKLGSIYVLQNRFDEALVEFRAALNINPDSQEAKDILRFLEGTKR